MSLPLSNTNRRPGVSLSVIMVGWESPVLGNQPVLGNIKTKNFNFIALIQPIQSTIANPVGADQPAKRQKKTSCVSTGWPVPVLCIRQVAYGIYFLSRQHDVIASFSFGACTVQTCFQQSPEF